MFDGFAFVGVSQTLGPTAHRLTNDVLLTASLKATVEPALNSNPD